MYKLLKINGVQFPNPEGGFSVNKKDLYNEYEGEDGTKTIEIVRTGIVSASVTYKGLISDTLKLLSPALKTVSDVEYYDPMTDEIKTIVAQISSVKTDKSWYKGNLSVWKLSFNIDEL